MDGVIKRVVIVPSVNVITVWTIKTCDLFVEVGDSC